MMVLASLLSTLVALAPVAAQDAPAPQTPSEAPERESRTGDMRDGYRVIVGRTHPELIPEERAWDIFFTLADAMADHRGDPTHPDYVDFVRGNVFLSTADAAVVLDVANRYRRPLRAANRGEAVPDEDWDWVGAESGAHPGESPAQRDERRCRHALEEVLQRVTPHGARAIQRYIAAHVKPGMVTGVRP